MVDQSQLTLNRLFESVLQLCRMSHLPKSLFGPVAFADLPTMSRLYTIQALQALLFKRQGPPNTTLWQHSFLDLAILTPREFRLYESMKKCYCDLKKLCCQSIVLEWPCLLKNFVGAIFWWVFELTLKSSRCAKLRNMDWLLFHFWVKELKNH